MTLEEAIKHAEEVAYEQDMKAGFETDNQTYIMSEEEREKCKECAEDHRQLAGWLKELRVFKSRKGQWLRMSDLPNDVDDRFECSRCGNVVHHRSVMDLRTFSRWCGRCGSDNG